MAGFLAVISALAPSKKGFEPIKYSRIANRVANQMLPGNVSVNGSVIPINGLKTIIGIIKITDHQKRRFMSVISIFAIPESSDMC